MHEEKRIKEIMAAIKAAMLKVDNLEAITWEVDVGRILHLACRQLDCGFETILLALRLVSN